MDTDEEKHFEYALGFAVVRRWADLSRETQQLLFDDPLLAVLAISSLERDRLRASKRSSRSKSNKRYLSVPT
jgi:hypothetical protein